MECITKLERMTLSNRTLSPEKVSEVSTDGEGEGGDGSIGYKSESVRTGEGEKVKSWEKSISDVSFIFIRRESRPYGKN